MHGAATSPNADAWNLSVGKNFWKNSSALLDNPDLGPVRFAASAQEK
jgi:hypothetical protein